MATESVTKTVEFDLSTNRPCGLFQVNAGTATDHALAYADITLGFVHRRLSRGLSDLTDDDVFVLAILTDMSRSLYKAAGAEA